jgi:hypothetical protein
VNVSATGKYSEEDHYGFVSDSATEPAFSRKKAVSLESQRNGRASTFPSAGFERKRKKSGGTYA